MTTVAEILHLTHASACVECVKCSAACAMAEMYPDFSTNASPRAFVQKTLRHAAELGDLPELASLQRCLQCGNCSKICPEGVYCAGLIAQLREEAKSSARQGFAFCAECGREIPSTPVQQWLNAPLELKNDPDTELSLPGYLQKYLAEEPPSIPQKSAYSALCPVCRRQAYAAENG